MSETIVEEQPKEEQSLKKPLRIKILEWLRRKRGQQKPDRPEISKKDSTVATTSASETGQQKKSLPWAHEKFGPKEIQGALDRVAEEVPKELETYKALERKAAQVNTQRLSQKDTGFRNKGLVRKPAA